MTFDWNRRDDPQYLWEFHQRRKKEERRQKIIAGLVVGIPTLLILLVIMWATTTLPGDRGWNQLVREKYEKFDLCQENVRRLQMQGRDKGLSCAPVDERYRYYYPEK
jgi:hypothetical protein